MGSEMFNFAKPPRGPRSKRKEANLSSSPSHDKPDYKNVGEGNAILCTTKSNMFSRQIFAAAAAFAMLASVQVLITDTNALTALPQHEATHDACRKQFCSALAGMHVVSRRGLTLTSVLSLFPLPTPFSFLYLFSPILSIRTSFIFVLSLHSCSLASPSLKSFCSRPFSLSPISSGFAVRPFRINRLSR
jgi:hypothetical protein